MILGAAAVPPFVLVQFVIGLLVALASQPGIDKSARYTVVKTASGDCVGRIGSETGGVTLVLFGLWKPQDLPQETHVPTAQVRAFPVTKLKGKRVRTYQGDMGTVAGVVGSPLTGNSVKVPIASGREAIIAATGLCLAPGEKRP